MHARTCHGSQEISISIGKYISGIHKLSIWVHSSAGSRIDKNDGRRRPRYRHDWQEAEKRTRSPRTSVMAPSTPRCEREGHTHCGTGRASSLRGRPSLRLLAFTAFWRRAPPARGRRISTAGRRGTAGGPPPAPGGRAPWRGSCPALTGGAEGGPC